MATIVDVIGTAALITDESVAGGVTTELNVSCYRPIKPGDVASLSAETLQAGKTLASIRVSIHRKSDGKLVAEGRHGKYVANPFEKARALEAKL